jgi:acyl dehydratase
MALNYDAIMAYRPGDIPAAYSARDCILYALGIGVGMDPTDEGQLQFVYERNLAAFPTMPSVLGWMGRMNDPEFGIDERMVVLADLKVVLHRPLSTEAKLISRARVKEIIDRGAGGNAILQFSRDLVAEDGALVATVENSVLARKHGGFGGKVTAAPEPHAVPERAPDLHCDLPTPPNLALLFRLNGDLNPLHADPERAKVAGFPRPILHGVASFGVAAHAILRTLAGYQPARLAGIEARFSRPVFPGESIRTEMWTDGPQVFFRCRVVERDEIVLTNGLAVLR